MPSNTVYASESPEILEQASADLEITNYTLTCLRDFNYEIGMQQSRLFPYDGLQNRIAI